jgi:hypothetical protein
MRCGVMPARYAKHALMRDVQGTLCRWQIAVESAATRARADPALLEDPWGRALWVGHE